MPCLLRIEGEERRIEDIRRQLLADAVPVSEVHRVNPDSKQLSTPWASPEVIENLKFVTAALQTSGAAIGLLVSIRGLLKKDDAVLVQSKESSAQLKLDKSTSDESIKDFAKQGDLNSKVT
jgi:hypothetical protein